jgi:endonuclease IV
VYTTVRHSRNTEKPKYSTVIFINESKRDGETNKRRYDETKKTDLKMELSRSDIVHDTYMKDIPVKEKSKFTMTNYNRTFDKIYDHGDFD